MFGKKKKEPKVEQVFNSSDEKNNQDQNNEDLEKLNLNKNAIDENDNGSDSEDLSKFQIDKLEKLDEVKSKISKILQSADVEIVDENFGDEYETGDGSDSDKKKQQDYDELKALFGEGDKNKKKELTLTIDDFDYTYVGQYVDEFDLLHAKSIKKLKMHRKHSKLMKRLLIAASVLVVVAVGIIVSIVLTRETPIYLKSVKLNQTESEYYVYDHFNYTGLYFLAEYSDGTTQRIKLDKSHLTNIVGLYDLDSQNNVQFRAGGNKAVLTFAYQGFSIDYTVNIKEKTESGIYAEYTSGLFNLKAGDIISKDYIRLAITYADFGDEFLDISNFKIYINENGYGSYEECEYKYNQGGFEVPELMTLSSNTKFKITYKTFELIISYVEGQHTARS